MPPSPYIVSFILFSAGAQCSRDPVFHFSFFYFHIEGETSRLWMFNYKVLCGSVFFFYSFRFDFASIKTFSAPRRLYRDVIPSHLGNILLLPSSKYWITCAIYLIIIAIVIERYLYHSFFIFLLPLFIILITISFYVYHIYYIMCIIIIIFYWSILNLPVQAWWSLYIIVFFI